MGRINESHVKIVWQFLPYTYPTKSELVFARKKYNLRAKAPFTAVYAAACAFFAKKTFAQNRRKKSTLRRFYNDIAPILRIS